MNPLLRRLARAPTLLYKLHLGWLLGNRFLLLHHRGRRTRRSYATVLEVVLHNATTNSYYVAAGYGAGSDWYRNVLASPHVQIQVGRCRWEAIAESLAMEEAQAVLTSYGRQRKLSFRFLARLFGLQGLSPTELAQRLPMVRFRTTQPVRDEVVRSEPVREASRRSIAIAGLTTQRLS